MPFTLNDNSITAASSDDDTSVHRWAGIQLYSQQDSVSADFTGNTIDGSGTTVPTTGVSVWNTPTTGTLTLSGGSISGVQTGVLVDNNNATYGAASGNTHVTIDGVSISASQVGVNVDAELATSGLNVSATVTDNTDITTGGTGVGIQVTGALASATITNNSSSIHDNATGIDVNGSTATITGNHIYDNGTGIRIEHGGSATVQNDNFEGTTPTAHDSTQENGTDLELDSSGATLTGGLTGNTFAGNSYYINNGTASDIDATGDNFDDSGSAQTNNFRIEDRMFHKVDDETKGLITWVANNDFVTAPGTHSTGTTDTDSTIQRGIDAAPAGFTVNVEHGTYAENLTINKDISVDGEGGSGNTIAPMVTLTAVNSGLVTITSTTATDNISLQDIAFEGKNGSTVAGEGILSNANASYGTLSVNRSTFADLPFDAISINGDNVNGVSAQCRRDQCDLRQ